MPTILAHELLLGVAAPVAGSGATSPTTSVGGIGSGGGSGSGIGIGSGSGMNAAVAPLGNICNTLPHAPCSTATTALASGGAASSSLAGLPLNRNLVMLRNHLRKNTAGSGLQTPLHDDKDQ